MVHCPPRRLAGGLEAEERNGRPSASAKANAGQGLEAEGSRGPFWRRPIAPATALNIKVEGGAIYRPLPPPVLSLDGSASMPTAAPQLGAAPTPTDTPAASTNPPSSRRVCVLLLPTRRRRRRRQQQRSHLSPDLDDGAAAAPRNSDRGPGRRGGGRESVATGEERPARGDGGKGRETGGVCAGGAST